MKDLKDCIPEGARAVLAQIMNELKFFETKYDMTSKEFYEKFQAGEMPETEEFFQWRHTYSGYKNIHKLFGLDG